MGFCPVVLGVGNPGKGKTKAGYIVLAAVGAYLNMLFNMFMDAQNGEVAAQTTMGFQADDLTDPSKLGKAAKRFFSNGRNATMKTENTPKCIAVIIPGVLYFLNLTPWCLFRTWP